MTAPEEVGKVATSAIEALKASPSCLVAVIFAITMALLTYFSLRDEQAQLHERQMLMISKCFPHEPEHDYHPPRNEP
jgi:hypothetical protein